MSYLKLSPDLFLGSQELNRLVKSLDQDGFRKLFLKDSISFGLFDLKDGAFDNFKISQGTNVGTIKNEEGYAVDSNGNILYRPAVDNIAIPNDNAFYWIKIKHQYSPNELGLVSIDVNGNLVGVGTEFLNILRGQPNNPVTIRLEGSTLNTGEYEVLEVIDDENAILMGDFLAESNLKLVVVGAFTPDTVTPSENKEIYQYDSCLMTLVAESVSNTPPVLIEGQEFLVARLKRNGGSLVIQDKRSVNIYASKADYSLKEISVSNNPLIGIEAVKFNNNKTTREENIAYLSWTFRSSNWTIDSSVNRVTLITGLGGKYKSTLNFVDGDFDGWRLYTKDGKYSVVKQSSLSAGQINLILESLDPDSFIDTTQQLVVTPNAEQIEIIFSSEPSDGTNLTDKRSLFPINIGQASIPLTVYKYPLCTYNVKYRYKNFKTWSEETAIPSDTVNGYFVEADFDIDGVQIDTLKKTYTSHSTNGFIELIMATNAYSNRIESIETGDLFGVDYLELNNASPILSFEVGQRKQYQIVRTVPIVDGGLGEPYSLLVNHYINLRTDLPADLNDGNQFIFQFKGNYTPGAFSINFTQDYVNPGDVGTVKYTLTALDFAESILDNLLVRCVFDGTDWIVYPMIHRRSASSPPSGSAGGDLTGTYPNPTIGASKVTTTKIADANVTAAKLAAGAAVSNIGFTPYNATNPSSFISTISGIGAGGDLTGIYPNPTVATGAITSAKIADGTIVKGDIAASQVLKTNFSVQAIKYDITLWDMDTNANYVIAHGLAANRQFIVGQFCSILGNGTLTPYVSSSSSSTADDLSIGFNVTNIVLTRGVTFDSASYNASTGYILLFVLTEG